MFGWVRKLFLAVKSLFVGDIEEEYEPVVAEEIEEYEPDIEEYEPEIEDKPDIHDAKLRKDGSRRYNRINLHYRVKMSGQTFDNVRRFRIKPTGDSGLRKKIDILSSFVEEELGRARTKEKVRETVTYDDGSVKIRMRRRKIHMEEIVKYTEIRAFHWEGKKDD